MGVGVWGRMDARIHVAKSLPCSPETTTTLLTDYTPIQTKKFKVKEYWSGLLLPSPGDLLDPGTEPASLALQVDSLFLSHQGSPRTLVPLVLQMKSLGHHHMEVTESLRSDPDPFTFGVPTTALAVASLLITLDSTCKLRCHHTQQASRCGFRYTQEVLTQHDLE